MKILTYVDLADIVGSIRYIDHDEAEKIILAIDEGKADYEFTVSVVTKLVRSLKESTGPDESPLTPEDIGFGDEAPDE